MLICVGWSSLAVAGSTGRPSPLERELLLDIPFPSGACLLGRVSPSERELLPFTGSLMPSAAHKGGGKAPLASFPPADTGSCGNTAILIGTADAFSRALHHSSSCSGTLTEAAGRKLCSVPAAAWLPEGCV